MTSQKASIQALEIPEILYKIVQHLEGKDIGTATLVSKLFYQIFIPYAWQNIHFGNDAADLVLKYNPGTFARRVSTSNIPEDLTCIEYDPSNPEQHPLIHIFNCSKWVSSLSIHEHFSILPLMFGLQCQELKSIAMQGLTPGCEKKYWQYCKQIFLKNITSLQSVTLSNWTFINKPTPCLPTWSPIERCVEAPRLRCLSLYGCTLKGRHWVSFWKVCENLEELRLEGVQLDLSRSPLGVGRDWPTFPRLKKLDLRSQERQLDLIQLFPNIHVLCWRASNKEVRKKFCDLYAAITWPELDWIEFNEYLSHVSDRDLCKVLDSARKPFRWIGLYTVDISSCTLESYKRHFEVTRKIVIVNCKPALRSGLVRILEQSPLLEYFRVDELTAKDIIDSKPWVCTRLTEFVSPINMGFGNNGNARRLTPEELGQCRMVYSKLGTLKNVEVLDMFSVHSVAREASQGENPGFVTIPLRLKAGLDQLCKWTRLRKIVFWHGPQVLPKKELDWMVDSWRNLDDIVGVWNIGFQQTNSYADGYLRSKKIKGWLGTKGVNTERCVYYPQEVMCYENPKDWIESDEDQTIQDILIK